MLSGYAAMDWDVPRGQAEVISEKVPISVDGVVQYSGYMIDGVA